MITAVVLSKDRPAQLDLLLRSLERNGGGLFDVTVLMGGSRLRFDLDRDAHWQNELDFEEDVRLLLDDAHDLVCFMCDDGIFYRPLPYDPQQYLTENEWAWPFLCFSLRLGENTTVCYPSGLQQRVPGLRWRWPEQPLDPGVSDFGYPGSVDGHIFRRTDLLEILDGYRFPNPTALEVALYSGCLAKMRERRPLMACYPRSVYVGNPVNQVSAQSNVRYGTRFPASVEECRLRFERGERLCLDAMDFSQVDGAHSEVRLVWS